tara:strand:- start:596 stop:1471 length:876 start_codon:yes stop_codon:yes gene_type:complete
MHNRRGIILAGGSGTRLHPLTVSITKQLMPIYDKPLIYYSISCLMLSKIRDILLISTPNHIELFEKLLGDGSQWGINIQYKVQNKPEGIAQALILSEQFLQGSPSLLILGDNIFYGDKLSQRLQETSQNNESTIFVHQVNNPGDYGVAKLDKNNKVVDIVEKPTTYIGNWVVTGLYFYDNDASNYAKELKPSSRGELEITDLNKSYLALNKLNVEFLGRGFTWLDTGTHDNLLEASNFISTIQKRQGFMVCCPEEIAFRNKWIDENKLEQLINNYKNTDYGLYLQYMLINS